jgi:hypothetical protein
VYAYISALIPGYIVISIFNQTCLVKCIVCVLEVTVFFPCSSLCQYWYVGSGLLHVVRPN